MDKPPTRKEASSISFFMYKCTKTLDEMVRFMDKNGVNDEEISKRKIKAIALSNLFCRGFRLFAYNPFTEKDPNKKLIIQKGPNPPIIGKPYLNPFTKIDEALGGIPRSAVPNNPKLHNYVVIENGKVYMNGNRYKPKLWKGHMTLLYVQKDITYHERLAIILWELFDEKGIDREKETVTYYDNEIENCHILNLRKIPKNATITETSPKAVLQINPRTGKVIKYESVEDANNKTHFGKTNIRRWSKKKLFRKNYRWERVTTRDPRILQEPTLNKINPLVRTYMAVKAFDLNSAASHIMKTQPNQKGKNLWIKSQFKKLLKTEERQIYGYNISVDTPFDNKLQRTGIPTSNEFSIRYRILFIDESIGIDSILGEIPLAVKIGNIILYEHGKYRIIGESIIRPRTIKEIQKSISDRIEKRQLREVKNKERLALKVTKQKEINEKNKKYEVVRRWKKGKDIKIKEQKENEEEKRIRKVEDAEEENDMNEIDLRIGGIFEDDKYWPLANLVAKYFGILKNVTRRSIYKHLDNDNRNCHLLNISKEKSKIGKSKYEDDTDTSEFSDDSEDEDD